MKYIIAFTIINAVFTQMPFDLDSGEDFDGSMMGPGGPGGSKGPGGPGGFGRGGRGGRGRHHHFEPSFLRGQNETVKKEFFDIIKNENETITQQKTEVETWAQKYNLLDQVQEFEKNMTQFKTDLAKNVSELIAQLPAVQKQLEEIFNNEDQTRKQMFDSIRQLKNQSRQAVDVLFFIAGSFRPRRPRGPGGPGGPGGFTFGGMGGMGGMGSGMGGGMGLQGPFGGQGQRQGQQGGFRNQGGQNGRFQNIGGMSGGQMGGFRNNGGFGGQPNNFYPGGNSLE